MFSSVVDNDLELRCVLCVCVCMVGGGGGGGRGCLFRLPTAFSSFFGFHRGGGVLPYMGYIGTCRGIGYGF